MAGIVFTFCNGKATLMTPDAKNASSPSENEKFTPAESGNASNPSPHPDTQPAGNQLLDERAEKYLREVASPEDYPDAEDEQDMDETIQQVENEKADQ